MTALSKTYYIIPPDYIHIHNHKSDEILDIKDIKTKILIYEDLIRGWFLDVAQYLTIKNKVKLSSGEEFDTNEGGFVVLSLAIAYIEGNEQFREGKLSEIVLPNGQRKSKSCELFITGMRRIFNKEDVPKEVLQHFYRQVRCGLFHNGITGSNVLISGDYPDPVRNISGVIWINPYKFLDSILKDFNEYLMELKDENNPKWRPCFEKRWNLEIGRG